MGRCIGCENPDVSAETQGVIGASRWLARDGTHGLARKGTKGTGYWVLVTGY